MPDSKFVHLHNHTEHSFLDGVPTMEALVERVIELGQSAVAITDHGEVSGHLRFQRATEGTGVKPIFGTEAYFVEDRKKREKIRGESEYEHITLLAKNEEGLKNLWILSSLAYIDGMYFKPRVDFDLLEQFHEGIIATSGCINGCVAAFFAEKEKANHDTGMHRLGMFMDIFGEDFLIEIHTYQLKEQKKLNQAMVSLAKNHGIRTIAVSDSHYLRPEDWEKHELLTAAGMHMKATDNKRYTYGEDALHVHSEDDVRRKLLSHLSAEDVEQAIDNTAWVADQCNVVITSSQTFPVFLDGPESDEKELRSIAWQRFDERISKLGLEPDLVQEYRSRLEFELELIISKGFAGYFLVVSDVVVWAKDNGILMGPGRGSVGGSLLAYILRITEVDPIRAGLMFERFLNPGRNNLPDIDVDVPKEDRARIRDYLSDRYHDVVTIGTLTTMAAKSAMNDFCRVLNVPFGDSIAMGKIIGDTKDRIAKNKKWDEIKQDQELLFAPWKRKYPQLFELMDEFAHHARQAGAHAGGLIVTQDDLLGRVPLRVITEKPEKDEKGKERKIIITQMDMEDVEDLGLLKIDLLGVRTLSTLDVAMKLVRESHPEIPDFVDWQDDWDKFYKDKDVYESLWDGKNVGVFQIGTRGISELATRFKPTDLNEICALISLFRPGITRAIDPETRMNLVDMFIAKRDGKVKAKYKHPALEDILSDTYGNFLYQEQVMKACGVLAGFDATEQDDVRKAMGKKDVKKMEVQRQKFIQGCKEAGIPSEVSGSVFDDMETFAGYGFNKSHGYGYGILGYWCAWMRYYYPKEFLSACFITDTKKQTLYARECRRIGIPLLVPDVNESTSIFTGVPNGIRYGLKAVAYVGANADKIVENRPYTSMTDLIDKVGYLNKRALESLVRVGAMDSIIQPTDRPPYIPESWSERKVALWLLYRAKTKVLVRDSKDGEDGIFSVHHDRFEVYAEDMSIDDKERCEEVLLGECVSGPPFGKLTDLIRASTTYTEGSGVEGAYYRLGGRITEVKITKTKKKQESMAIVTVEYPIFDGDELVDIGSIRMPAFPEAYRQMSKKLNIGQVVICNIQGLESRGEFCLMRVITASDLEEDNGNQSGSEAAEHGQTDSEPRQEVHA